MEKTGSAMVREHTSFIQLQALERARQALVQLVPMMGARMG